VRVGELEKEFVLYKFRTMRQDAENSTGAVWAQKNDPRVTRVGKLLRKTRIDELPQLYNVLKGEMSFVGPRPERPEFVSELKKHIPYYPERHFVKPGVTGWAQIRYPYGASVEDAVEKLRHDLYYIKNISLFLDVLIFIETVKVMLFGRGAR
jgi:lipopolysaccharide/colanic/teichoic acid biosynthesis glycosyltransferase